MEKEASSYSLLAMILVDFAEKLSQSLNIEYKYDPQFVVCDNDLPGTNPTTDAALLALLEGSVRDLRDLGPLGRIPHDCNVEHVVETHHHYLTLHQQRPQVA